MCYKPEMRKWMSERLKRRKKEPEKAGAEPAPAPLQPAFYDTEPAKPGPAAEVSHAASAPLQPEAAQDIPTAEPQAVQPRQSENGDVAKRRRRRGRGGRGRSRSGAPPVESAAAGSDPARQMQVAPKERAASAVAA